MSSAVTYTSPEMLPKLAEWHVYGNEQQGRFLTKYPEELTPTYYGTEVTDDIKDNKFKRQLGKKAYELKDHLGNVRTTFSDVKIPTGNISQPFEVDLLSKSEYYPYGMKINDLSYNATDARYGYNGKENDNEVKGDNNSLDFGARIYDPRVSRFLSQDPMKKDFPSASPFIYAANNPITNIDKNGEYAYAFHYIITYIALIRADVDKVTADKIAYYASTYADHPETDANLLKGDNFFTVFAPLYNADIMSDYDFDPSLLDYRDLKHLKENIDSQADDNYTSVILHCMRTYFELTSAEEAVCRTLEGDDTFFGAYEILNKFKGMDFSKLNDDELKEIGLAFHTIQDSFIHKGSRWVFQNKDKAVTGFVNEHPGFDCTTGEGWEDVLKLFESDVKMLLYPIETKMKTNNEGEIE